MDAKEIVKALSQHVNTLSSKPADFVNAIAIEHRTLQQSMGRLFFACIAYWAKQYEDGNYDLRNEAICKLSKQIIDAIGIKNLPFI